MNFIHDLQVANQNRNAEWDPDSKLTPLFFAVELAGEVGEVCNMVKKMEREALGIKGSRVTFRQLEDEIGDAMICLALLANAYDINLEYVTARKFNETSEKLGLECRL